MTAGTPATGLVLCSFLFVSLQASRFDLIGMTVHTNRQAHACSINIQSCASASSCNALGMYLHFCSPFLQHV